MSKLKKEVQDLIHRKENRFNEIGELANGGKTFNERLQRTLIKHKGKRQARAVKMKFIIRKGCWKA